MFATLMTATVFLRKNYKWTLIVDAVGGGCEVCRGEETDIQQDGGAGVQSRTMELTEGDRMI